MLSVAVFVCFGWIVSVCIHEFGHALVAYWGGDTSVKDKGYLTLNPLKYTDSNLSLIVPIIFLLIGGIALPGAAVYIEQRRLRNRWWKSAVAAAGPIASAIVTLFLAIIFRFSSALIPREYWWIYPALAILIFLQIYVIIINSLPIPSLDGYGVIEPWLPHEIQVQLRKFGGTGFIFLFMLLWIVKPLNIFFGRLAASIAEMLGVPGLAIAGGFSLFHKSSSVLLIAVIGVIFLVRKLTRKPHEWYERGKALCKTRQYEKANAAYDKAIQIKPDYYEAWLKRGLVLYILQRWSEANASLDKAIRIKPEDYTAWYYQGSALIKLKRYEEAIASYDKIIEIKPDDPAIWTDRGVALGYLQRYEEAIASCDKAIQINPEYPYAWHNKAGCYAEQGKVDLAVESLQQAINLDLHKFKELAKTDPSFDSIRENELFKQLIG